VRLLDAGFTIAVVTLKLKWQRAGGGSLTGVDRKDLDCSRGNYKMPYCQLKISQGETRHWKISYGSVSGQHQGGKCLVLVLGNSVIWNVGSDSSDMIIECFPGIRTEQLHRVIDKRPREPGYCRSTCRNN
jgi:hypothetical protein